MATITTAIRVQDAMTPAFHSMNNALNIILNSFETLQATTGKAVDIENIRTAREELANANATIIQVEENVKRLNNKSDKMPQNFESANNSADGLLNRVKQIALAIGGITAVKNILNLSDKMTNTTARLNLIIDDGGSVQELENKIFESAQRSRANYMETASTVAKLSMNAGKAFKNNDETIAFAELLNKQFVIAGSEQSEIASASLQLTQALGAGALRGEELNAVFEAAPPIIQSIADYLNVDIGQIKALASEGKISADIVKNAMFSSADSINEKFNSMPMTWGQVFTNIKNKALKMLQPVLNKINQIANNEKFQKIINGITNAISIAVQVASPLLDIVISIASFIIDNWSIIAPIIGGIVSALALYYGAQLALNIITGIGTMIKSAHTFATELHATALAMQTDATFTATAAQYGFNTALLACPITWIILAIIIVIALIYAMVAAVSKIEGKSISTIGIICGMVTLAGAIVWNVIVGVVNAIFGIIDTVANGIISVVEWVLNVCNGGFNSFGDAVANLLGSIIAGFLDLGAVVTKIIDAIFGTNWTASLNALSNKVQQWGKNDKSITLERWNHSLNRVDYQDAVNAGYKLGTDIEDKFKKVFKTENPDKTGYEDLVNNLNNTAENTGTTAGNTGDIKNSLDMAEEDLKYLRDIAERDVINRFTIAEIKVEMNNNNNINGDQDIDGIVNKLGQKLEERLMITAEGVYI